MKEILTWTVTIWNMYWGTGWIQYLLALGGACILVFGRKSEIGLRLLWYTAFLLVLFFCPVSGQMIMRCIGKDVYWRVLWLLPVVPLIAGGFTTYVSKIGNRIVQMGLIIVLAAAVVVSGTGMIKAGNFERVSNRQQVPDEIAMICERINNDRNGNEIRIAADEYASSYIRVYDPALNMAYGRRGAGAVDKNAKKLYQQINAPVPDGKKISKLADLVNCTYVVMMAADEKFLSDMESGGYEILGTAGSYYIFVCEKYK